MNHGTAIVQRPESLEDRNAIARFLAERGATPCPPSAAAIMGEWRPGLWREAERKAERRGGKALDRQQRSLRQRYPTAEADHPRFVTVTRELVDSGASGVDWKGDPVGWTNRQVAILDPESKVKPVKGWRYRSDGRQIPWSAAVAFLTSAKRKKLRPKPSSRAEAEAIDTLKRLAAGQTSAPRQRAVQAVGNPTAPLAPLEIRIQITQPEDMLALLLGDDTACPICRGSRVGHGGAVCALCVPPWE